jgi:dGTP triphosphohydrolase
MVAGIVAPFDFLSVDDDTLNAIAGDVNHQMRKRFPRVPKVSNVDVLVELAHVFENILEDAAKITGKGRYDLEKWNHKATFVGRSYGESILHAENPLIRRQFLETLIQRTIDSINVRLNVERPFQSTVEISYDRLLVIECLKAFNFHKVIATKRIQMAQYRSREILTCLFETLTKDLSRGYLLTDEQRLYLRTLRLRNERMRFVCDIIASLSDLEAVRLYGRLSGDGAGNFAEYL